MTDDGIVAVRRPYARPVHLARARPDDGGGVVAVCGAWLERAEVVRRRARHLCSRCRREARTP